MSKYLLNTKTGVVWDYTDELASLQEMAPCDEKGMKVGPIVETVIAPVQQPDEIHVVADEPPVVETAMDPKGMDPKEYEFTQADIDKCVAAIGRMVVGNAKKLDPGARIWTRPHQESKGKPWAESLGIEAGITGMTPELRDAAWATYNKNDKAA